MAPKRMNEKAYKRAGIYSIEEVYEIVKGFDGDAQIGDIVVHRDSLRYKIFFSSGVACKKCGLEGRYFALEQDKVKSNGPENRFHFNLYGVNDKNEEVMLTKDHIVPRSLGGKDRECNLQTYCRRCNQAKGNNINL